MSGIKDLIKQERAINASLRNDLKLLQSKHEAMLEANAKLMERVQELRSVCANIGEETTQRGSRLKDCVQQDEGDCSPKPLL